MTALRKRMLEDLQRRNYNPDCIRGYLLAVEQFANHFNKSPELMGPEEIGEFQLHLLREKKLALGTIALRIGALRFLYKKTLKRRDLDFDDLPLLKTPKKLPVVLSPDEVTRLIEAAPNLLYRTLLMLLYATGLRRAEAANLKVSDIDSSRMLIMSTKAKDRATENFRLPRNCSEPSAIIGGQSKGSLAFTCFPAAGPRRKSSQPPTKRCGTPVMNRLYARASENESAPTHCATVSRPTCWRLEPTCAPSSCSWDNGISRTPRYICIYRAAISAPPPIRSIRSRCVSSRAKPQPRRSIVREAATLGGG